MKVHYFFTVVILVSAILLAFRISEKQEEKTVFDISAYKKQNIIRCSPDWNELKEWIEETDIPPLPGAGIYKWKISTSNDSAQFYFNQGINMYYSFHIIEAMASFKKAARFDPDCAMLYWAQALSYGPNINDYGYRASSEALGATNRAKELAKNVTPIEKKLIDAISVRYTADSADATRSSLNKDYTAMMKKVYKNYPGNAEAMALYADAMMLEHPWDLWFNNGTPKEWTPRIREVLEKLIAKFPGHPGGNHYYIHVMEPSPYADKALPSAFKLGKTNPGLSHVVHMPSHIFLRTGLYQKGVDVNVDAVNSYRKSIPLYAPVTGADFLYIIHNQHMKANNAMLLGNYKISQASALETREAVPVDYLSMQAPLGSLLQYIYMTPVFAYVRYGKWNELLLEPEPNPLHTYARILYHFGRGMALVNVSRPAEAKHELNEMRHLMKDSSLLLPMIPYSPAIEGARTGENILAGTIALSEKKQEDAIAFFTSAVTTEENMIYNEPRDWLLNPKHYLGNAYLQKNDGVNAEKVFKKDLLNNKDNVWALLGLHKALLLQNKITEAETIMRKFRKALFGTDRIISSPVY